MLNIFKSTSPSSWSSCSLSITSISFYFLLEIKGISVWPWDYSGGALSQFHSCCRLSIWYIPSAWCSSTLNSLWFWMTKHWWLTGQALIKMSFLTQPMLCTSAGCEAPSKSRGIVVTAAVKSIADKQNPHCTHDKAQLQPCLQCLGTVWFNSTEGSLFWFPRWDNSEFEQNLTQLPVSFIETLLKLVFWNPVSPK